MNLFRLKYFAPAAGAALCLVMASFASAQSVDDIMEADAARIAQAAQSQQRVDAIASETDTLVNQFRTVLKDIENLRVRNRQLELQIADQEQILADLAQSIDEATSMEVDLVPMQLQMVNALEQFIELDLPFRLNERRERVDRLVSNMDRSDLSTAEKFRQILEAYRIEREYSVAIDNYTATIPVGGVDLEVDILRLGRIALTYQTKDQAITGAWNKDTQQWEQIDSGTFRNAIALGLRIAREQAAPELVQVPIPAPQG